MTAQADPLSADDQFFAALLGVNRDALDRLLAPDFLLIDVMTGSENPRAPFLDLVGSGQLVFETPSIPLTEGCAGIKTWR